MKDSRLFTLLIVVIILLISWLMISKEEKDIEGINEKEKINEGQYSDEETQILLYFLDSEKIKLVEEYRYVNLEEIKSNMLKTIIEELIKGPNSKDLVASIPKETKVNSILKEENKVIVDFSKEFNNESVNELQKIYSVVNTLTEIKEIEEVEIRVDGEKMASEKRIWVAGSNGDVPVAFVANWQSKHQNIYYD